jgi:hypothetical protein
MKDRAVQIIEDLIQTLEQVMATAEQHGEDTYYAEPFIIAAEKYIKEHNERSLGGA